MSDDGQLIADELRGQLERGLGRLLSIGPAVPQPGAAFSRGPRIVICTRGRHPMAVPGGRLSLQRGDVLLMPPGSWNRALPGPRRRYCSLSLQDDGLRCFMRRHDGRGLASSPMHVRMLPRPAADDRALWRLPYTAGGRARVSLVSSLAWRCLDLLASADEGTDAGLRRWQDICAWLEEQLPQLPSRSACAAHFGIHPGYLSRLFQERGERFQDWCMARRLDLARTLLRADPSTPVTAVAAACDYGDARYFRRLYKRRFGLPPSQDR